MYRVTLVKRAINHPLCFNGYKTSSEEETTIREAGSIKRDSDYLANAHRHHEGDENDFPKTDRLHKKDENYCPNTQSLLKKTKSLTPFQNAGKTSWETK